MDASFVLAVVLLLGMTGGAIYCLVNGIPAYEPKKKDGDA